MGTLATVIEAPIKGALGSEVNVGDTVMVVTTGYSHRVSVRKGIYRGYIEGKYNKRARIEVEAERSVYVNPDGTDFNWNKDYDSQTWTTVRPTLTTRVEKYIVKTTLNRNRIATIASAVEADTIDKIGKLV